MASRKNFDELDRCNVLWLAFIGTPIKQIARDMNCSLETLYKHFSTELKFSKNKVRGMALNQLVKFLTSQNEHLRFKAIELVLKGERKSKNELTDEQLEVLDRWEQYKIGHEKQE